MNINVTHLEASIRRFHSAATVLAEKASGLSVDEMEFFPIIIGESPNFMAKTSPTGIANPDFFTPFIVNASFSLEILLKAILYYETGEWETGHNLIKLYEKVSTPIKREANESFKKLTSSNKHYRDAQKQSKSLLGKDFKWNLASVLSCSSRAFENWRYAFEESTKNSGFYGYQEAFEVLSSAKEKVKLAAEQKT